MTTRKILAAAAVAFLALGAAACSSDESADSTTTTKAPTTTAGQSSTTASGGSAPCTEEALALAGTASGPQGTFDTVTEYECDGGYAYAWLVDSANPGAGTISEIFKDEGGTWESVGGPLCDNTAAGNVPSQILSKGCEYANAG